MTPSYTVLLRTTEIHVSGSRKGMTLSYSILLYHTEIHVSGLEDDF